MGVARRISAARVALAALLVVVAAVILISGAAHRLVLLGLEDARQIATARPAYAMALVVLLSALAAMLAFVSSWVLVPFAVFTWGAPLALLLLWTGWLLGGAATYATGRFLGRPAMRWFVHSDSLARYEQRFARHMPFYVVLLVQLSLPSEIPGYLLGVVRYSFGRYLAALGLVELAYGIVTVYLGQSVLERRIVPVLGGLMLLALITLAAAFSLRGQVVHARSGNGGA
jgi:uncharacterized membrane protein YdjX (TVP38/TMEM64 family)